MAKMADASDGVAPAGRRSSGLISPAMEKPLATTTFRAVRAEARPMLSADRRVISITDALNSGFQNDPATRDQNGARQVNGTGTDGEHGHIIPAHEKRRRAIR